MEVADDRHRHADPVQLLHDAGTAAAAASLLTVTRTSSLPARASASTCRTAAATSAVSVLVMDWTTIGCPEPTGTPPTRTATVERRMVAGMGGNITSCMPDTPREGARRAAITGVATYVPERVVTNADLARRLDTSDEWIVTRTGIRERRLAARGKPRPAWARRRCAG